MSEQDTPIRRVTKILERENLYYGNGANANHDPSWAIGLEGHPFPPTQQYVLNVEAPVIIGGFVNGTEQLLNQSLSANRDPSFNRLNRYLTAGVPEETLEFWNNSIKKEQHVLSIRPDMVSTGGVLLPGKEVTLGGELKIIEYNVDGGADKGNTQGVNYYSQEGLEMETIGQNLAILFLEQIRNMYPDKEVITIATVLPEGYREEYNLQNSFFARHANELGKMVGVRWVAAKLSEIEIQDSRVVIKKGEETIPITAIDREFELPGYHKDHVFGMEKLLLEAVFEGKVDLLGSLLPHSDKILQSTIFDAEYSSVFDPTMLAEMQALHAETSVLDPDQGGVMLGNTWYSFEDLANLVPDFPMVLKAGGVNNGTTGSAGVDFSPNKKFAHTTSFNDELEVWKKKLYAAIHDPQKNGYSVIQHFYPSDLFDVAMIQNERKKPHRYDVAVRIAPYYVRVTDPVWGKDIFTLGNILVTAGTDRETRLRKNGKGDNIHGQSENTYNPGVPGEDGLEWQAF